MLYHLSSQSELHFIVPYPSEIPEFYFIEVSQAAPFVDTLRNLGSPIEKLASQAGMPLDVIRNGSGVIGERSLWRFLEYASKLFPNENIGYRTALEHPVTSVAQLGGMRMRLATSLEQVLNNFVEDVKTESTGADYTLRNDRGCTWFHREPVFRESTASWLNESYVIAFVIQIVRICADENWLPKALRVSSCDSAMPVPTEWESIDIDWGHRATEIRIDRKTMALPPRIDYRVVDHTTPPKLDKKFLKNSLEGLVDRQIWTRKVGISRLADEMGVSEATCKRRLQELGETYRSIVEQRRYRLACQLLSDSSTSLRNIAHGLGYQHQPNFTRAFKRVGGETPSVYRRRAKDGN